jgi:DMSO reductase anchor subunit
MFNAIAMVFARDPIISWSSPWTYVMFAALLLMIIMGTWTGAVAAGRGRSMQWWFIIGFFLPIIGLIIVYILKPIDKASPSKN